MNDFQSRREARRQRRNEVMGFRDGHQRGHVWTGVLLLLVGIAALLRSYMPDFPRWVSSWQMLLIVLGLFVGFRHRFYGVAWFVLILIGGIFLANDYFLKGELRIHIWPVILIVIGIFFIFRSSSASRCGSVKKNPGETGGGNFMDPGKESYSQEDFIDTTSIFGGTKKIILSKDFKGGDIVNVFGGTELNFTQADIKNIAVLELTTIFGGTKLIIPSHWSVRSEAVTIFGGIEDKRQMPPLNDQPEKVIVLKGTVIFGGIDIKSF